MAKKYTAINYMKIATFDLFLQDVLLGLINYEIAASDLSENVLLGMC